MSNTKAVLLSYPTYPSLEPIVRGIQKRSFPENRSVENPKEAVTQNRTEEHHQEDSFGQAFQKIESHAERFANAEGLIESCGTANFDQKFQVLHKLFSILVQDLNNDNRFTPKIYIVSHYILLNIVNLCENLMNDTATLDPDQEVTRDAMVFVFFFLNFITYFKQTVQQKNADESKVLTLSLALEQFHEFLVAKNYLIKYKKLLTEKEIFVDFHHTLNNLMDWCCYYSDYKMHNKRLQTHWDEIIGVPELAPFDLYFANLISETPQKPDIVDSLKWFLRFFQSPNPYNRSHSSNATLVIKFIPILFDLWLDQNYADTLKTGNNITQLLHLTWFLVRKSTVEEFNNADFFNKLIIRLDACVKYADKQSPTDAWIEINDSFVIDSNKNRNYFGTVHSMLSYLVLILSCPKNLVISKDNLKQLITSIRLCRQRLEQIGAHKRIYTQDLLEHEEKLKLLI